MTWLRERDTWMADYLDPIRGRTSAQARQSLLCVTGVVVCDVDCRGARRPGQLEHRRRPSAAPDYQGPAEFPQASIEVGQRLRQEGKPACMRPESAQYLLVDDEGWDHRG